MKQVELYAKVRYAVRIEGLSERAAARRFGIGPRTVSKMLAFYREAYTPAEDSSSEYTSGFARTLQMATARAAGSGASMQYVYAATSGNARVVITGFRSAMVKCTDWMPLSSLPV